MENFNKVKTILRSIPCNIYFDIDNPSIQSVIQNQNDYFRPSES
jgi:hypothetical protein